MKGAQGMYGRGMQRPIAKVTFFARSIMANQWVAACRDRTTPAPHSNSNFPAILKGIPMEHGIPDDPTNPMRPA